MSFVNTKLTFIYLKGIITERIFSGSFPKMLQHQAEAGATSESLGISQEVAGEPELLSQVH